MRILHIISHTHWDREWYRAFQQLRLSLVHLVDGLLELLETDPDFKHFMLDGQTIILDDYLRIRPEKEAIIRQHVQDGRILIGPWHILPDMFLVGPEAHIRNLLQGERTARRFGPKMGVGYIPDPFGHPAQIPQILRGFGIDMACVWRGLDAEPAEFWWQSPDGSRVLMAYLRDSYSNGASLPAENELLFAESLARLGDSLAAHSAAQDFLIFYGTDHMEPPPNTAKAIAYADQALPETRVFHSTLLAYFSAIRSCLESTQPALDLPVVTGELRACKRMHLLPGVLSVRMWIKQRNHACENLLTRWVEPFSTFASLVRTKNVLPNPANTIRNPEALIHQAWLLLMENHPHDSICGCSLDQVHAEMQVRFDQAEQIGDELTQQSLESLAAAIHTCAFPDSEDPAIVVFNPSHFRRSDLVEFEVKLPPDSADFEITDEAGHVLPHETLSLGTQELVNARMSPKELRSSLAMVSEGRIMGLGIRAIQIDCASDTATLDVILSEQEPEKAVWERGMHDVLALLTQPDIVTFHVRARTADLVRGVFNISDVPGLGWRTFHVRCLATQKPPLRVPPLARALLPLVTRLASTSLGQSLLNRLQRAPANRPPYRIENEFLAVEVEADGALTITDKRNGAVYRGMNRFLDGGDCGDTYNYAPPAVDLETTPRLKRASVQRGPVRQSLELEMLLRTPAGLSTDRQSRSRHRVEIPIRSRVSLSSGLARIDIHTEIENRARDHRLRVHFPTPFQVDEATYDGHFEFTRRKVGIPSFDRAEWVEDPRPEAPQRTFVQLAEGGRGLSIANRGLPEVEVRKTAGGVEIALTLLRCVGWLSRDDFSTRRGHAGPAIETPGAQLIGTWAFDYAICPQASRPAADKYEMAYAFETPMRTVCTSAHSGYLPGIGSFVSIDTTSGSPDSFIVTTVKRSETGAGWLLRGYNSSDQTINLSLTPLIQPQSAAQVNLAEEKLAGLAFDPTTSSLSLSVKPHEIIGILFST